MSERYAGLPITDDDATIAMALEDLSVPTLLVSLVHLTGDVSILDGPLRPVGSYLNEVQGFMAPDDQAAARAFALEKIIEFREGGSVLPPPPSSEVIHQMMEFLVAAEVPQEYVPLMLEELALDGTDARDLSWVDEVDAATKAAFHVVIIGAGMSGLLAGIKLGAAGISYTIIEKNSGVGGTWFENRYPGCRVDVGNHFYSYSFAPDDGWSEYFAQQPELQAYFDRCMHDYGVAEHVRFDTEVRSARWDAATSTWTVDTSGGALEANAVISAVGQLNRPKLPDIDGIDSFEGQAMHSAQWVDGTDVTGKRVAVIGTGASAFQLVPTTAPDVEQLTVFQRSAQWMFPNPNYHAEVGPGVAWAIRHLPYYGRWYRFLLFWPACDAGLVAMTVDPDYPDPEHGISAINDAARDMFTQWMAEQVGDDPELLAKVVPDYVCLGKRTLQDNGSWLGALTRPNVDLVTEGIERITPTGVRTVDGVDHDVDLLVFATGFHANKYLWPMEIVGREGVVLGEQWGDRPTALLGITVPHFPNLFCLYGPGTNLASGGSLIFHSECQVRYVMGCIGELMADDVSAIEVRQDAHDDYNVRLQEQLAKMVWSHPSIRTSWYRNDEGEIYILSPWRLVDYWAWTKTPDLDHFHLT